MNLYMAGRGSTILLWNEIAFVHACFLFLSLLIGGILRYRKLNQHAVRIIYLTKHRFDR